MTDSAFARQLEKLRRARPGLIDLITVYTIIMFLWDLQKASTNLKKHQVSFEEAVTAFSDPEGLEWEDQSSQSEKRWKRIGASSESRLLLVVYTVRRTKDDKETIRIISAREASRKDRKAYLG